MLEKNLAKSIVEDVLKSVAHLEKITAKIDNIEDEKTRILLKKKLINLIGVDVDNFLSAVLHFHPDLDPLKYKKYVSENDKLT